MNIWDDYVYVEGFQHTSLWEFQALIGCMLLTAAFLTRPRGQIARQIASVITWKIGV